MFEDLRDKIKNKQIILFGEIHGTKEIPEMLSKFFSEILKNEDFNLCLEIPEEFQMGVDKFMIAGNEDILKKISFFSENADSDGRNSLEYFNLIKNIYKINLKNNRDVRVFCIDSFAHNQEEKEKGLAKNILGLFENKKTFVIMGDVHASKNPLLLGKLKINPTGFLLFNEFKDKLYSIRIMPTKGSFFNFGVKEIVGQSISDTFNKNFDYVYLVGKVTPCSFL